MRPTFALLWFPMALSAALPGHVKLFDDFVKPKSVAPRAIVKPPKVVQASKPAAAKVTGNCAHIRIYPTPKDTDPKMVLPNPDRTIDGMPIYPGTPACSETRR